MHHCIKSCLSSTLEQPLQAQAQPVQERAQKLGQRQKQRKKQEPFQSCPDDHLLQQYHRAQAAAPVVLPLCGFHPIPDPPLVAPVRASYHVSTWNASKRDNTGAAAWYAREGRRACEREATDRANAIDDGGLE